MASPSPSMIAVAARRAPSRPVIRALAEAVRRLEELEALVRYGSAPAARSLRSSKKNPAGGPAGLKEHYSNSGITRSADALNAVLPDRCRLHMSNLAGEFSRGSSLDVCRTHKFAHHVAEPCCVFFKEAFSKLPFYLHDRGKVIPQPAFSLHGWLASDAAKASRPEQGSPQTAYGAPWRPSLIWGCLPSRDPLTALSDSVTTRQGYAESAVNRRPMCSVCTPKPSRLGLLVRFKAARRSYTVKWRARAHSLLHAVEPQRQVLEPQRQVLLRDA